MITAATVALILSAQSGVEWPELVQFHCRFSKVFTVTRRHNDWEVVTDLRTPMEANSFAFNTRSGAWSLWGVRDRGSYRSGAQVQTTSRSLSISYLDSAIYSTEVPPGKTIGLVGTDARSASGRTTWTWFGAPDDGEGVMVVSFVSDRLVSTDTGVCRRTILSSWAQQTHPARD